MPQNIKKYIFLLPLLSVLAINIYFRSFPIYFPQIKNKAREVLYKSIEQRVAQDVYSKFSQFNPLAKDKLIRSRFSEYKKLNAKIINKQIQEGYVQLKDRFQDENKQTYLMELDPWHWARYVDNVLKFGHPGDKVEDGKQIDILMEAPEGSQLHWEHFFYYFSAFLYKVFSLFKKVPLFTFVFYMPLLFAAIFITLLYMFSYRYSGHLGAIISCMVMGLAPIFIQRSCAGWFKKDALGLIFSLLVIWSYITASSASSFKAKTLWTCLAAFWVGLFCYSWTHWWFIFLIIVIYEALFIIFLTFTHFYFKKDNLPILKEHILSIILFVIFTFFWDIILSGVDPIIEFYHHLILAITLNRPLLPSIWPNVYSTVGELRSMGIKEIANSIGGMFILAASLVSIVALLIISLVNKEYAGSKRNAVLILVIWTLAMLFASSRGIRFVMFLPFSMGISLGWVTHEIYVYFKKRKNITAVVLVIIAFLIFNGTIISRTYAVASSIYPLMDDIWYKVLNLIKEKTPEGTMVNSWWDFGDWFKAVARRPVIFDGQSQDSPRAYWMAKALLSSNEEEAIGILRMLNNGGNKAFEIIDGYLKDPLESVLLLESIISSQPEKTQEVLKNFLPIPVAQEVMKLLFSLPPRACFVVDYSMIPKMAAISYLGTWDFSKVYIAQNFSKEEKYQIIEHLKGLGRDVQEMQRYYQEVFLIKPENLDDWLSHRILFYSDVANGKEKDGVVFFDNGFIYNSKDQTIRSNAGQIPRSLFVLQGNNFVEISYPNANSGFSVLLVKAEGGYKSILLDRQLANSMFVRLYFFRGLGLKHFTPLIDSEEGNNNIRVFNIIW